MTWQVVVSGLAFQAIPSSHHPWSLMTWQVVVSGLTWEAIGGSRPMSGIEIEHEALAGALHAKLSAGSPLQFSPSEYSAFDVVKLRHDSFVRTGTAEKAQYCKPTGGRNVLRMKVVATFL
jgi:hypothetical protein